VSPNTSNNSNAADAVSASGNVRLEIFMDKESSKVSEVQKFVEFEKRITSLEKIIGADKIKDNEGKDKIQLVSRLESLQKTISLLNPSNLD
jgi:hypothetical protein